MKVSCPKADLDIFMDTYSGYCSAMTSNSNVPLLKSDSSFKGIDLNKQVETEVQFEKLISEAWKEYKSKGSPEALQRGILKAYMVIQKKDLTHDPEYSPTLVQNIMDSNVHASPQNLQPSHVSPGPRRPDMSITSPQNPPPRTMGDLSPPGVQSPVQPPHRQGIMHSGGSFDYAGHNLSNDHLDHKPTSPPVPLPISNPKPADIRRSSPMSGGESAGKNQPAFSNNYGGNSGNSGRNSWGASPPAEDIPRFGPPSVNTPIQRASPYGPSPRVQPQEPSSQLASSNWLKPEPYKPANDRTPAVNLPQTEAWEYKPDITYSQMVKQAPSESTLFNTPGMYETERQKMRDQLVRQRQREFEDQLTVIRNQRSQEYNSPMHPFDFKANPSQIWSNQYMGNTYHSLNDDYLKSLQEKVFQSNSEFRKEQLDYQMLSNSVNTYQKATAFFEKETNQLTQKASDLTAKSERLGVEISGLSHEKEDLLQKIERKRAELLEQKRHANATSDTDQLRKRELLDEVASMRRLAAYKTSELSRVKAKYDEMERDYHNHSLATSKAAQSPMRVMEKSLTASALKDWAPWRNRFEENSGPKQRRTHADLSTTLTQGESASFLADLNRSVDNLLNTNSDRSSYKYRNR